MTPLEIIVEWRKGCSCASEGYPEECEQCTRIMIDVLERKLRCKPTAYYIKATGAFYLDDNRISNNDRLLGVTVLYE